jgi:hypothetical protein
MTRLIKKILDIKIKNINQKNNDKIKLKNWMK